MSLAQQIESQLVNSMKDGLAARTGVLRLLKSSFKNEQIKLGHELSDDETLKVIQREAKQRKDSITAYEAAGRDELARGEAAELKIIEEFLPEQLDETALAKLVDEVIAEVGAGDMSQMGVVIGAVMKRAGAATDGGAVSQIVKSKLSA